MRVAVLPAMYKTLRYSTLCALLLALQPNLLLADGLRERSAATFGGIESVTAEEVADPVAQLGRALFWDTRLSADGKTACASCHAASSWGADGRKLSPDARGELTKRNSQTVFNAQDATAGQRWLADRATGAEQALGSITGSMGFDKREALPPLLRKYGYSNQFQRAFPGVADPLTPRYYAQALQSYQQTLRTPAAFDRWLAGDDTALDEQQLRGLQRFIDTGCAACHSGALFGGSSLQRFGVVEDYRAYTGSQSGDVGLMDVTHKQADRDVFRVQPLRNAARTAPYFHDGSVAGLTDAITVMAKVQLGRDLPQEEVADIARFLEALTGPVPAHYGPPELQ